MKRNYIVDRLDSYFKNHYTLNRTPLLIGPSGVAKSALIKEAARKNNMRVVDIRTAFMSRLDIEGLSEKVEIDGKVFSAASPMLSLVKCTDEYLRVARECCAVIQKEIDNTEDTKKIAVLKKSLARLSEEAKTPVLLFDEISRGEASVRQVLTKILTDKEFMGYSMKEARVVAATNSQLNAKGEIVDVYAVNDAQDVAFYDRFESVYIAPSVMVPVWREWASKNLHKAVVENSIGVEYDDQHFSGAVEYSEAMVTPYPCFRTWEMVSNYQKYCDKNGIKFSSEFISTMVGGDLDTSKYSMDEFIRTAVASNTPALIISPSGMGKTSRINSIVKENGYEFISINLSEVDRIDLEGLPVKRETIKAMFEGVAINKNIAEQVREIVEKSSLPNMCTVRAPKKQYVDSFKRAVSSGKKTVIYFDECNRVQNVSVMSAIFQVISDNRLFGVDFDPSNVVTILSCNLDDNCGDAQDLDPALCARFAIYRKRGYTSADATAYREYVKTKDFYPVVREYLETLSHSELSTILDSVNYRTMETSSASSRAWEDLSTSLKTEDNPVITGMTLISSEADYKILSEFTKYGLVDKASLTMVINRAKIRAKKWAGYFLDDSKEYKERVTKVIGDLTSKNTEDIISDASLISSIISLDQDVWDYRRNFFFMFLGDKSTAFCDWYNKRESIETIAMSPSMGNQEVIELFESLGTDPEVLTQALNKIPGTFGKLDSRMMRAAWREIMNTCTPKDMRVILIKVNEDVIDLLRDRDFINTVYNKAGVVYPGYVNSVTL